MPKGVDMERKMGGSIGRIGWRDRGCYSKTVIDDVSLITD
jgi:hypothetical protein